jgi:hypothetical protein
MPDMNQAFCQCGRAHTWNGHRGTLPYSNGNMAVCPCGKILEPQTLLEFEESQREHSTMLCMVIDRLKELR